MPISCTVLQVWLKGLHCLNGLQHLAVQLYDPPAAAAGASGGLDNIALLQQAIPDLTHLTALHLRGAAAHDTALEHLSTLACLQELELTWRNKTVTQASFKELPCSLTRLRLRFYIGSNLESDTYDPGFHFRYFGVHLFRMRKAVHVLHLSIVWCDHHVLAPQQLQYQG